MPALTFNHFVTNIPGLYIVGTFTPRYSVVKAINAAHFFVENLVKQETCRRSGEKNIFDLLIVGAGPAGLSAGLTAHQQQVHYLVLEESQLAATIRKYPRGKIFIVNYLGEQQPLFGLLPFYDAAVEEIVYEWEKLSQALNVKTFQPVVDIKPTNEGLVVQSATGQLYTARAVLLALGQEGAPGRLGIPGETLPHVFHRFPSVHTHCDEKIVVIGGGNSAIEAAIELSRTNQVALSYRKPNFTRLTEANLAQVTSLQKQGKIKIFFESLVEEIFEQSVRLHVSYKTIEIPAQTVYVLIGFTPKIEFFKKIGCDVEAFIKKQQEN